MAGLPHRLVAPQIPEGAVAAVPGPARVVAPVRLRIPAIGVDASVGTVTINPAGALEPPPSDTNAGWWPGSPSPGAVGAAVIVGHLDSRTGPAVFAGLSMLKPGDNVLVQHTDGSTAVFQVRRLDVFPKSRFPTAEVYGRTANAQLRLITCGGTYDRVTQTYLSNLVVFADLVSTTATAPRR
ncbi:class F sortase [Streptacidiphilus sp. N1-3]|uniref:Class F sortase n=1 Tax=Streptacidiphilus alkalitolerans TaxID=3342712 RepID=A0ABV6WXP6_9ACTN